LEREFSHVSLDTKSTAASPATSSPSSNNNLSYDSPSDNIDTREHKIRLGDVLIPIGVGGLLLFLFFNRKHIPLNDSLIDSANLHGVDKVFFNTGQFVCESMVTIGWESFFYNHCVVGNIVFTIPNYIQVGQFTLIGLAILAGEEIFRRSRN
jgi:hypothetical protein